MSVKTVCVSLSAEFQDICILISGIERAAIRDPAERSGNDFWIVSHN